MVKKKDQEEELYDILTVSLPGENIKINEAFISDFECKYKLSFIRKYKLGEVLQRVGHSGFVIIGWCVLIWKSWQNMIGKA